MLAILIMVVPKLPYIVMIRISVLMIGVIRLLGADMILMIVMITMLVLLNNVNIMLANIKLWIAKIMITALMIGAMKISDVNTPMLFVMITMLVLLSTVIHPMAATILR
jgi:hypothetical protein